MVGFQVSPSFPEFPPIPHHQPLPKSQTSSLGFRCQAHDGPRMNLWCQCSLWGGRLGRGYLGYPPGNQHIHWKVHFEDDFPFPQVGYVNFLFFSSHFFQPGLAIFFPVSFLFFKLFLVSNIFFWLIFWIFTPIPEKDDLVWLIFSHIFSIGSLEAEKKQRWKGME